MPTQLRRQQSKSTPLNSSINTQSVQQTMLRLTPTKNEPIPPLVASIANLLFDDKYSDMTISCGGREFKAHRVVVCSQSPFFEKAYAHDFKESAEGIIKLPEDDPEILEHFLRFLYTGQCEVALRTASNEDFEMDSFIENPDQQKQPDQTESVTPTVRDLTLLVRIYVMADKFGVYPLTKLASARFFELAEHTWIDIKEFPNLVDEIYRNTPPTDFRIRRNVCRLVSKKLDDAKMLKRMEPVIREHGDFAFGLLDYARRRGERQ